MREFKWILFLVVSYFFAVLCMCVVPIVIHDYVIKLTASEENQQELLLVLDKTKRMGYARDLQISMLESDGQLMLEKCEY